MAKKKNIATAAAAAVLGLTALVATAATASADTRFGDMANCAFADRVNGELSIGLAFGAVHVSYDACVKNRTAMGPYFREVIAAGDPTPTIHGLTSLPLAYEAFVEPGTWRGQYSSSATYDFTYVQQVVSLKRFGLIPVRYDMQLTIQADKAELCIDDPMGHHCETQSLIGR